MCVPTSKLKKFTCTAVDIMSKLFGSIMNLNCNRYPDLRLVVLNSNAPVFSSAKSKSAAAPKVNFMNIGLSVGHNNMLILSGKITILPYREYIRQNNIKNSTSISSTLCWHLVKWWTRIVSLWLRPKGLAIFCSIVLLLRYRFLKKK